MLLSIVLLLVLAAPARAQEFTESEATEGDALKRTIVVQVERFPLEGESVEQLQRNLEEMVRGDPGRFGWLLSSRLELDYDFAFSIPRDADRHEMTHVDTRLDIDLRRCEVPARIWLPEEETFDRLPPERRSAWRERIERLRYWQLLHLRVIYQSGLVERLCEDVAGLETVRIPLIRRVELTRERVKIYLRDEVALVVEEYSSFLDEQHEALERTLATAGWANFEPTAFFSAVRRRASEWTPKSPG